MIAKCIKTRRIVDLAKTTGHLCITCDPLQTVQVSLTEECFNFAGFGLLTSFGKVVYSHTIGEPGMKCRFL